MMKNIPSFLDCTSAPMPLKINQKFLFFARKVNMCRRIIFLMVMMKNMSGSALKLNKILSLNNNHPEVRIFPGWPLMILMRGLFKEISLYNWRFSWLPGLEQSEEMWSLCPKILPVLERKLTFVDTFIL